MFFIFFFLRTQSFREKKTTKGFKIKFKRKDPQTSQDTDITSMIRLRVTRGYKLK